MIKLKEAVIVEGKYDKIKLQGIIDAPIIETNGFRIFNDKSKQRLLRQIADQRGIVIMTDSDSGGFVIRNFLKGILDNSKIKHCYIPEILGKEKRKEKQSKEGMLGVEGVANEIILSAIQKCGATVIGEHTPGKTPEHAELTKADLYELGLTGREHSAALRKALLEKLDMPGYMTTNAMLVAINCLYSKKNIVDILENLDYNRYIN